MTVAKGATLAGTGTTNSIIAQSESIIEPGYGDNAVGTLKTSFNLIMQKGATIVIKAKDGSNSKINVAGAMFTMAGNDTILIMPIDGKTFQVGDRLVIFNGQRPASGWIIKSTDGSLWDDSMLATDGSITCTQATTDIETTEQDDEIVDVITIDGKPMRSKVKRGTATAGLPHGLYIVGGKVVKI